MFRFLAWVLLLSFPLAQSPQSTGTKIVIRRVSGRHSSEQVIYRTADKRRTEFRNFVQQKGSDGSVEWVLEPEMAIIERCDLGESFVLKLKTAEYTSAPYPLKPSSPEELAARGTTKPEATEPDRPTLQIETTTVDTGERREMFGHTARRTITTTKQTPLEGSQQQFQETITDGWYIDLNQELSCDQTSSVKRGYVMSAALLGSGKVPREKPEFVDIGPRETGLAVKEVRISRGSHGLPDGTRAHSRVLIESEVTLFEEGLQDPNLFEVPNGFQHVALLPGNQ